MYIMPHSIMHNIIHTVFKFKYLLTRIFTYCVNKTITFYGTQFDDSSPTVFGIIEKAESISVTIWRV